MKDWITILISTTALSISIYQLWDSRKKKVNIYFRPTIKYKNEVISHVLKFTIVNESSRKIHIYDTRFYIYYRNGQRFRVPFNNLKKERAYFASTDGHITGVTIEQDNPRKVEVDAFEVFSYVKNKEKEICKFRILLIDLDGRRYAKNIDLNLLKKNEFKESTNDSFYYPLQFYKYEVKTEKEKRTQKRWIDSSTDLFDQ